MIIISRDSIKKDYDTIAKVKNSIKKSTSTFVFPESDTRQENALCQNYYNNLKHLCRDCLICGELVDLFGKTKKSK